MPLEPGWVDKRGCALCGRGTAPLVEPRIPLYSPVCLGCAERLGRFVLESRKEVSSKFWNVTQKGEPLGAQLPNPPRRAEPSVHMDMATAFSEMDLVEDALVEAALALLSGPKPDTAKAALELIFGPKLSVAAARWSDDLRTLLFPV